MIRSITEAIESLPAEEIREWREINGDVLTDWSAMYTWTPTHVDAVAAAMSSWWLWTTDAQAAMGTVVASDPRVGVWLSCVAARTSLRYVTDGEERPRLAIEAAERWVRGEETGEECSRASILLKSFIQQTNPLYQSSDWLADLAKPLPRETGFRSAAYAASEAAELAYLASNETVDTRSWLGKRAGPILGLAAAAGAYFINKDLGTEEALLAFSTERDKRLREIVQIISYSCRDAIEAAAEGYLKNSLLWRQRNA